MLAPEIARRVIVEACGKGPQSIPMLAAHMLNAGENVASIYATVRVHLPTLMDNGKIEAVELSNGTTIYRLPAKAAFETLSDGGDK